MGRRIPPGRLPTILPTRLISPMPGVSLEAMRSSNRQTGRSSERTRKAASSSDAGELNQGLNPKLRSFASEQKANDQPFAGLKWSYRAACRGVRTSTPALVRPGKTQPDLLEEQSVLPRKPSAIDFTGLLDKYALHAPLAAFRGNLDGLKRCLAILQPELGKEAREKLVRLLEDYVAVPARLRELHLRFARKLPQPDFRVTAEDGGLTVKIAGTAPGAAFVAVAAVVPFRTAVAETGEFELRIPLLGKDASTALVYSILPDARLRSDYCSLALPAPPETSYPFFSLLGHKEAAGLRKKPLDRLLTAAREELSGASRKELKSIDEARLSELQAEALKMRQLFK